MSTAALLVRRGVEGWRPAVLPGAVNGPTAPWRLTGQNEQVIDQPQHLQKGSHSTEASWLVSTMHSGVWGVACMAKAPAGRVFQPGLVPSRTAPTPAQRPTGMKSGMRSMGDRA